MDSLPFDHSGIYLSRDVARLGDDRRLLTRALSKGELVRIRRGAYVDSARWAATPGHRRHVMRVRAAALATQHPPLFSHLSAAAVWSLPILGPWPDAVHTLHPRADGGRSSGGIVRHGVDLGLVSSQVLDGLRVTSIERTLLDLARTMPFASAVMSLDHALASDLDRREPMTTKDLLREELDRVGWVHGRGRVLRVINFGDGASGSPGESLSRSRFYELGFPAPDLQTTFVHHSGTVDRVDFDWPDYGLVGEFDGHGKYLDPRLTSGLTPAEIVIREKQREDRLRTRRPHFARWEWADALRPSRLMAILLDAGLPRSEVRHL